MSAAWAGDAGGAAHVTAAAVPVAARQSAPAAVSTVTLRERRAEHNHGSWRANECLQSDAGAPYGPRLPSPLTGRRPIPGNKPFGKSVPPRVADLARVRVPGRLLVTISHPECFRQANMPD